MNNIFDQQNPRLLIRAMLTLKTEDECRAFLEDIMTTREILDISQRMAVARELDAGASTLKIAETTGASPTTISPITDPPEKAARKAASSPWPAHTAT